MKIKRPRLFRSTAAVAGAAALAVGLTVATQASPAQAAAGPGYLMFCDFLNNTSHSIDAWDGSKWLGNAPLGKCQYADIGPQGTWVNFYINNTGIYLGGDWVSAQGLNVTWIGDAPYNASQNTWVISGIG
jgi:hypothetical protein